MTATLSIRDRQAPLKAGYQADPASALQITRVFSTTTGDDPMRIQIGTETGNNARWNAVKSATVGVYPEGHAVTSNHFPFTDLGPSIDEWVQKALAIDRNKRFERVRAMWDALLTALNQRPPRRTMRAGTPARS